MKYILKTVIAFSLFANCHAAIQVFTSVTEFQRGGVGFTWGGYPQGVGLGFGSFYATTTIEFDLALQQIRAYGTATGGVFSTGGSASQSQIIGYDTYTPPFPAPPIPVITPIYRDATLTVGATITLPGFSFDTGVRSFAWDGTRYSFLAPVNISFNGQLDITYNLETGASSVSGSETYALDYFMETSMWALVADGYPGSLGVVSGARTGTPFTAHELENFTAPNGFQQSLAVIPEPSFMFSMAASGMIFCFFRKRGVAKA